MFLKRLLKRPEHGDYRIVKEVTTCKSAHSLTKKTLYVVQMYDYGGPFGEYTWCYCQSFKDFHEALGCVEKVWIKKSIKKEVVWP